MAMFTENLPQSADIATADGEPISAPSARHTRTAIAWFGLCAATVMTLVLVVFMLQNTRSTEVSFLWMHGTVPLALALLIAGVGCALLTMVVGVARITQLRRRASR